MKPTRFNPIFRSPKRQPRSNCINKVVIKISYINQLPEQVDLDCINSISEIAIIFWWTMEYALFVKENMATEPVVRYDHRLNDNADSINALVYR